MYLFMIKNKHLLLLPIALLISGCGLIRPSYAAPSINPSVSDISPSVVSPSISDTSIEVVSPSISKEVSFPSISPLDGYGSNSDNFIINEDVASGFYNPGTLDTLEVISIESLTLYGDCTLFKYGNFEMLIDTNQYHDVDFNHVTNVLYNNINDGKLEILLTTHPHGDHVGAFTTSSVSDFLIEANIYEIGIFIDSGAVDNRYWENAKPTLKNMAEHYFIPYNMFNGDEPYIFYIADNVYLEILNTRLYVSEGTEVGDANLVSIAACFHYGNYKYLFCGDLNYEGEAMLDDYYPTYFKDEHYVVMKANHHGSSNGSNNSWFVDWAKPDKVLISAAIVERNRISNAKTPYGASYSGGSKVISTSGQHPHISALNSIVDNSNIGLDDLYWNGINGNLHFKHASIDSDPIIRGDGRSYDYVYYENYSYGDLITSSYLDEINTPFYRSSWAKQWNATKNLKLPTEV